PRGDAVLPGAPRLAVPPGQLEGHRLEAARDAVREALAGGVGRLLGDAILGAAGRAPEAHAADPRQRRGDLAARLLARAQRAGLAVARSGRRPHVGGSDAD